MPTSTITIEDIKKSIDSLPKSPFSPFTFCGLQVFEEPLPRPKLELSKHIQVTDKFRCEFNAWLLDMFGRQDPLLERDKCFIMETMNMIVVPHGKASIITSMGA